MGAAYTGAFELRRLVVKWSRGPSGGTQEDQDMVTFHLAKLVGGSPSAAWVAADYAACEARFDTFWTAIKANYPASSVLAEYRWFRDGPAWAPDDLAPGPPNPSERTTIRAVAGTAATALLPPQIAYTITEVVPIRKRWGRIYMPAPAGTTWLTTEGRIATANITTLLGSTVALYNGWRTDGFKPVVWSRGRSAYTTPRANAIPAHAATAYEIDSLQMDNLWDVVQSRRYDGPTVRSITALT